MYKINIYEMRIKMNLLDIPFRSKSGQVQKKSYIMMKKQANTDTNL